MLETSRFQIRYNPESSRARESRGGGIDGMAYEICAVNVNWNGDGWNVNANSVDNPNRWNEGNQVFSRNYLFSPVAFWREFLIQP